METSQFELDRRGFLGFTAAAAVGIAAVTPAASAAAQGPATPFTQWLDSIPGQHKVVLDVREPGEGMANAWAWVYLMTGPKAYQMAESDMGVAMVLRHNAIPLALGDAAWSKYKLGEVFRIDDPQTGKPALRHPFYTTMSEPLFPDMALQKLMQRGVKVAACDMAIFFYSGLVAKSMGVKHEDVQADWNAAVLPGITHAPSGVVACQGAVERGCSYIYAG